MKKKTPDTEKILNLLTKAKKPMSANALSSRARIAYDSVAKRIHDLKAEGYDITTVTRRGVDGAKATTYAL